MLIMLIMLIRGMIGDNHIHLPILVTMLLDEVCLVSLEYN